ncbi:uncharacterized protein LOC106459864 [Limulus polyphemus]|uniref:Uncharacterized protein LOC106459864 n=1 Tax=Limulus polyphemus TaxID=6850 RepID=A0ABM1B530_LIMPO|nr:uncharacterized protein LOC106459864 [Limulus polyphemus]XP_022242320.1 uncharacterized protein LOC106459864 [Limulus polyphemus]XP_022242325.1 uncharacterized protein LOC106459864 [Limulus polyphemus]
MPTYRRLCTFRNCTLLLILICLLLVAVWSSGFIHSASFRNFLAGEIVDFSGADNVTGFNNYIVPNVVHFVKLENHELEFVDMISIKAAFLHQHPEKILIHCDCQTLSGKYWEMVKDLPGLEIKFIQKPIYIFGQKLSSVYHASDIARLRILMSEGGIFLDSDAYVVKSLDPFRKFEMAIGWPPEQNLGTQVIIAHKNARFLKLWYHSYKYYKPERWYYNAGELPTQMILMRQPDLVHRVPYDFGVHDLAHFLYGVHRSDWQNFHAIHLLIRHKSYLVPSDPLEKFDEKNIKAYDKTFGDMARLVLFGKTDVILNVTSNV